MSLEPKNKDLRAEVPGNSGSQRAAPLPSSASSVRSSRSKSAKRRLTGHVQCGVIQSINNTEKACGCVYVSGGGRVEHSGYQSRSRTAKQMAHPQ